MLLYHDKILFQRFKGMDCCIGIKKIVILWYLISFFLDRPIAVSHWVDYVDSTAFSKFILCLVRGLSGLSGWRVRGSKKVWKISEKREGGDQKSITTYKVCVVGEG